MVTQNYKNYLKAIFLFNATNLGYNFKDTSGNVNIDKNLSTSTQFVKDVSMTSTLNSKAIDEYSTTYASSSNIYIGLSSVSVEESKDMYCIGDLITDLSVDKQSIFKSGDETITSITIKNNGIEEVEIQQFGIFSQKAGGGYFPMQLMMVFTLDTPLVIEAGLTGELQYSIKINI